MQVHQEEIPRVTEFLLNLFAYIVVPASLQRQRLCSMDVTWRVPDVLKVALQYLCMI